MARSDSGRTGDEPYKGGAKSPPSNAPKERRGAGKKAAGKRPPKTGKSDARAGGRKPAH